MYIYSTPVYKLTNRLLDILLRRNRFVMTNINYLVP